MTSISPGCPAATRAVLAADLTAPQLSRCKWVYTSFGDNQTPLRGLPETVKRLSYPITQNQIVLASIGRLIYVKGQFCRRRIIPTGRHEGCHRSTPLFWIYRSLMKK